MSYLYKQQARNKSSSQRRAQTNNYFSPYDKANSIYFRDTIKQFCPFQRFVDHRPNPHRPLLNPPTDNSYYNYPTERENYSPCYYDYRKGDLYPLLSKEDLKIFAVKLLKMNERELTYTKLLHFISSISSTKDENLTLSDIQSFMKEIKSNNMNKYVNSITNYCNETINIKNQDINWTKEIIDILFNRLG